MNAIKTTINFVKNSRDIVAALKTMDHLFKPRVGKDAHESILPGVYSQFSTLKNGDMSDQLIDLIFANSQFDPVIRDVYSFIQIQKYVDGDYIAPHRDVYDITKLHLVTLTSSDFDGLTCVENNKIVKIFDLAGTKIDFPYDAVHWVDPVKFLRYSLVVAE